MTEFEAAALGQIPFFSRLPPEELERLAAEVESKGIGAGPGTPEGVDAGSLNPDGVPQAVIEAASRPGPS